MVNIQTSRIKSAVSKMFSEICTRIDSPVLQAIKATTPANELEAFALEIMTENAEIAQKTDCAVCQDTGMAVVFLEIGQDVLLEGDYVIDAVNQGVAEAYVGFRKSVLTPLSRKNTSDNTPAVVHTSIVSGNQVKISCMAKGFGSENMSRLFMLAPSAGVNGIIEKVAQTVSEAGGCPCPPIIIGVGIGGTMEKASIMSKHALLRPIDTENANPTLNMLENEILEKVNSLNIGAQGFGGNATALKVLIEAYPTHIAGLPVAINIQCHCSRHAEMILEGEND